jgi:hypothetical protein
MEIVFEKVPFEEYLAFFKTENDDETEHWIAIQYDYLLEPSWLSFNTYELYCPSNISITRGSEFIIPTGFKCVSDFKKMTCIPCFDVIENIILTKDEIKKHIVLKGTAGENHCFQNGDRLLKLKFVA